MQNQLPIIYSMCTVELSGKLRKHIEVMPVMLSMVQTSTWVSLQAALSSKSHSQRTCFSHLCSSCTYWCNRMEFSSLMLPVVLQEPVSLWRPLCHSRQKQLRLLIFRQKTSKRFACMPFYLSMQIRILGLNFSALVTLDVNSKTNHVCVAPTKWCLILLPLQKYCMSFSPRSASPWKAACETGPLGRERLFQLHLKNKKVTAELLHYMLTTVAYNKKPNYTFKILVGFCLFS